MTDEHVTGEFDRAYWERHWHERPAQAGPPAHPALDAELAQLPPGRALDAGSGEGAEAVWLAAHGWDVTAVDVSAEAIARAQSRFAGLSTPGAVSWRQADLTVWEPAAPFDLVTTFYAHPTIGQEAFYRRISTWVAPGGTLLIVGHDGHGHGHGHGHGAHPAHTVTGADGIRAVLSPSAWDVRVAEVRERTLAAPSGMTVALRDVVAVAVRR